SYYSEIYKTEGEGYFRVFPRGVRPGKGPSKYRLLAFSERWPVDLSFLKAEAKKALELGKVLLAGVVDEEGDVTYYGITERDPRALIGSRRPAAATRGVLLVDRVMIPPGEGGRRLVEMGFYGKMEDEALLLSLVEAVHLSSLGLLEVENVSDGQGMTRDDLLSLGERVEDDFNIRLAVYGDLRERGLIAKTGFKYGTHFRAYDVHPDEGHARYLVHGISTPQISWQEISRGVRLAHGVKKEFLVCMANGSAEGRPEYLRFRRVTP
ncbi:MAG: tRNA-intron lyase, partial [Thermoplasmata archaeon]|nr:tRNA-intron lyase [Thermoplasmata archaeon]